MIDKIVEFIENLVKGILAIVYLLILFFLSIFIPMYIFLFILDLFR